MARGTFVLGVTGGIGVGKSTVARILASRGGRVLDADAIVRRLYSGGDLPARIAERFGPSVLAADGSVDRMALGRIVFSDEKARRDLEALVHPAVRREIEAGIDALRREGFTGLIVVDAALLVEASPPYPLDALLVVTAPMELRLARLLARGVTLGEARRRIASQTSDEARLARADAVVLNEGSLTQLWERVAAALAQLPRDVPFRSRYTAAQRAGTQGGDG